MSRTEAVDALRALHAQEHVLVVPNAWDAASAALFKASGAQAIATTSAGLAWSCGYPDGDALPHDDLLFAVRAVCRVSRDVPVTVDLESGYSKDPSAVASLVCELRGLGVAGINLEDGSGPPELLAEKIAAINSAVSQRGGIFINARADVYLRALASGEQAVLESIARGRRYEQAGADGFFVPALSDSDEIKRIASAVRLPLNILVRPGLPSLDALYELGVRRLSAGARLTEVALSAARRAAIAFMNDASRDEALAHADGVGFDEMNALFA